MQVTFPLRLAQGEAFCNRESERAHLANNIEQCQHTLVLSPRRYGKTSLVKQVIRENNHISANLDFLLVSDDESIQKEILDHVGKVITKIIPSYQQALIKLKKFMASFRPEIVLNEQGFKVKFSAGEVPKTAITEVLMQLDSLAEDAGVKVVLLFDEFQQIALIKNNQIIEAAIRHAAERANHVAYIFSGSNRRLLADMFENDQRPLYHMCDHIFLQRIKAHDLEPFIQKAAKKKWGELLSDQALEKILHLTKRHTYYVNLLCSRAWLQKQMPNDKDIETIWQNYCEEQQPRVNSDIVDLSLNQRAVIKSLAKSPRTKLTEMSFQKEVGLTSASIIQALEVLKKKDLVYVDDNNLTRLLDPANEYLLSGYYSED